MYLLITLLQEAQIEEKLKSAPDDDYSIGIFLGSLIPFAILVTLAYVIYRYNKNRYNED
jgi:hypothetical protein